MNICIYVRVRVSFHVFFFILFCFCTVFSASFRLKDNGKFLQHYCEFQLQLDTRGLLIVIHINIRRNRKKLRKKEEREKDREGQRRER